MSDYVMLPGARLEIGPNGQPEESLGACCSACASGASKCAGSGLGDLTFYAWGHKIPTPLVLGTAALGVYALFFRNSRRRR